MAIVYNPKTGKIIIGRREKDPYVKKLSWTFPGGRPGYSKDLEHYLKLEIKKKTNLNVKIKKMIFAKTYPEERKFLSIYYLVEPVNVSKEKAGEKFVETKWIRPTEINKFFTTSVHPEIMKILRKLEKS